MAEEVIRGWQILHTKFFYVDVFFCGMCLDAIDGI